MNIVILVGRLTKDPEIHTGDTKVAKYSIAVDRVTDGADFINCVAFKKQADFAEKYLTKGMKVAVEGCIRTGSYKNREDKTVYTTDVIVNRHEFVEPRKKEDENGFVQTDDGELPFK